ncbi:hypothetical protein WS71_09560 [Burkholderia mayonis]|uniref:Uncharacterized protein n=1 Tax=Burkholderia mayonis TaxID=1385591 RepID=A0A1B4FV19_9BURK|nr:hypothetical protein WS71_09560 [Burkholderia mayonis]KVE50907.1 hypothetical protein WS71_13600 [Burkholderia mayonis]
MAAHERATGAFPFVIGRDVRALGIALSSVRTRSRSACASSNRSGRCSAAGDATRRVDRALRSGDA